MNSSSHLAYAQYWLTSLLDADSTKGAFKNAKLLTTDYKRYPANALILGCLDTKAIDELFADEHENVKVISAAIRPKVFTANHSHGKSSADVIPAIITPIIFHASIERSGHMYPSYTFIARDLLEPLDRGSLAIGSVTELDAFLTKNSFTDYYGQYENSGITEKTKEDWLNSKWQDFLDHCNKLYAQIVDANALSDQYSLASHCLIIKKDVQSPSTHIRSLYQHIIKNKPVSALFNTYTSDKPSPIEPCISESRLLANRISHSGNRFHLADAQRDALNHALSSQEGEILAVNGPPGTGKTTLLLSIVACKWARAAIEGNNPSLIFAASTNNQAVTNIIDAFGKDFSNGTGAFAGRWLPEIHSFASYFPSKDKENEASSQYQTSSFFNQIENAEYVERASEQYISQAKNALPQLSNYAIENIVAELQSLIISEQNKLLEIQHAWEALESARQSLMSTLGKNPTETIKLLKQDFESAKAGLASLQESDEAWQSYLANEPLYLSMLTWLPPIRNKRLLLASQFLKRYTSQKFSSVLAVTQYFFNEIKSEQHRLNDSQLSYQNAEHLVQKLSESQSRWESALALFGSTHLSQQATLSECDTLADTTIRFNVFLLTTHYWEGRWLLAMNALIATKSLDTEKTKTGKSSVEKRWYRRMMITPCAVSTFFMLPKELKASRYNEGVFDDEYLYNIADLLIVDEAGQVLPEVAGASFSLSKTALVIGDTQQIEPIWSITKQIDLGNLISNNILPPDYDEASYSRIHQSGKLSSSGSVMQIAQHASRFQYQQDMDRGMYLLEHRRCFDEIINYCDELCYKKKLKPRRGSSPRENNLPAMGFLHIDGMCEKTNGSRHNLLEANTIAEWLLSNRSSLERYYQKPLFEIVGVVTPFADQVNAITLACRERAIPVGKGLQDITVGTIHSLQGAERSIIIFSPTYSKHANGGFIDDRRSRLNVAVSRAKDSFLVFGDMDTFSLCPPTTPRGLLAKHLLADYENRLNFKPLLRQDLKKSEQSTVGQLINAEAHDSFLIQTLLACQHDLIIVTPWLLPHCISDDILIAIKKAINRGASVSVYTDANFNKGRENEMTIAIDKLNTAGAKTLLVRNVHSKIVISDDTTYCVGSFNWFSADRQGQYKNYEVSIVYQGTSLKEEIQIVKNDLIHRQIK